MRVVCLIFLLCSSAGILSSAQAQSSEPDQRETIRALVQEVKELKSRVAALEAEKKQNKEAPGAAAETSPAPPTTASQESERFGVLRGIKIQGFGSVTYKASDANPPEASFFGFKPGSSGSFSVGDIDLFLTSRLTEKASVVGEVVFTEGDGQEFQADIERLLLKYDVNDYLHMSFGRFHTATSYYNSVFHHGRWGQTAADRPLVVEFSDDGGLLPSQAVGASVTGAVPSGKLGLNYVFEYASADTIRPLLGPPGATEIHEHNGNEITAGVFAKPDWLSGLNIGGSFYHDRLNPDNANFHIGQSIGSVHAVYVTPRFEFLNEAFLIQHKVQESGQTFNTSAFYSLVSRKFREKWRPYFRYQYANASSVSPIFSDVGLRHGPSAGVRYDFNDYVALKAQYDRIERRQLPSINDLLLQLAFRF